MYQTLQKIVSIAQPVRKFCRKAVGCLFYPPHRSEMCSKNHRNDTGSEPIQLVKINEEERKHSVDLSRFCEGKPLRNWDDNYMILKGLR